MDWVLGMTRRVALPTADISGGGQKKQCPIGGDSGGSEWKGIRKGWAFGSEEFRERITELMETSIAGRKRSSYSGQLVRKHDERQAAELIDRGLERLGLSKKALPLLKKGDPRKKALAWMLKSNTIVKNEWISRQLQTGSPSNIARMVKEADPKLIETLDLMMK
jgi:DNA-directed RNA polymerase subunit H (RpoH/RPB5)